MNWHERYAYQAGWTRELRAYLFKRSGWSTARRVLEVGCGTGAVLCDPTAAGLDDPIKPELFGLDISASTLAECHEQAADARLTCGDALSLPFPAAQFDITYCHFLLLWISDPLRALQEMKRTTAPAGYVLALAEPDYGAREDNPGDLALLGQRQNEALVKQGAALRRGADLADLFRIAGIRIIETGTLRRPKQGDLTAEAVENELSVLQSDLAGALTDEDLGRLRALGEEAAASGRPFMRVPTYFASGQV